MTLTIDKYSDCHSISKRSAPGASEEPAGDLKDYERIQCGKCVGIISAVIELKGFARAFHSNTANAFAEDIRKSKEAGMNAHISKPIQLDKMVCVIAGLVQDN